MSATNHPVSNARMTIELPKGRIPVEIPLCFCAAWAGLMSCSDLIERFWIRSSDGAI